MRALGQSVRGIGRLNARINDHYVLFALFDDCIFNNRAALCALGMLFTWLFAGRLGIYYPLRRNMDMRLDPFSINGHTIGQRSVNKLLRRERSLPNAFIKIPTVENISLFGRISRHIYIVISVNRYTCIIFAVNDKIDPKVIF